tara:strand:+ start:3560 stop:4789 length:1230 start_codon:yes stop_codon:yes gene_type:complete
MNLKKFNNYLLVYLFLLFVFGIFWLYVKHEVGNDSTISEWLINYQGGFTRRGLIGEICFQIAKYFDLRLRFVIFLFQSLMYSVFLILIYRFFRNISVNLAIIFAIFTPIFLLYPVAEIEVLARKETFVFIGLLVFLNISSSKYSSNYPLYYIFFILPIICLIWEPVVFFFPFVASILLIRLELEKDKVSKLLGKIIVCFIPATIAFLATAFLIISPENHLIMENSLELNFGEECYSSCGLFKYKSSIASQFVYTYRSLTLEAFVRYFLIILIGFGPLFLLCLNTKLKANFFLFRYFDSLFYPILIMLSPVIVMFAAMVDWGRVVNISYTFTVLFYFYLYKNNLLIINSKKIEKSISFLKNKKSLLIFCFIIYAFGWNPKTVLTGDVASFPGYRIPYKSIKTLYFQIKNN